MTAIVMPPYVEDIELRGDAGIGEVDKPVEKTGKRFSTFDATAVDALQEPMFFGHNVGVARFDQQKYNIFEKLTEKQLSYFWRPEEVDLTNDRKDFHTKLDDHEQHIFLSNLKYQTLLDSVQGRSPTAAFLPIASLPELENWFETWSFSETIHSRSYTHIIRNVMLNPSAVLDEVVLTPEIRKRAQAVTEDYDNFIELCNVYSLFSEFGTYTVEGTVYDCSEENMKYHLMRTMMSVYILEAVRFYVSFACSFAFAERGLMEGNAKIIKLIAR